MRATIRLLWSVVVVIGVAVLYMAVKVGRAVEYHRHDTRALLVQDYAPWGSTANDRVLQANGIAFDRATTGGLASVDLSVYDLVIVASDQPTLSYQNLAARMASWTPSSRPAALSNSTPPAGGASTATRRASTSPAACASGTRSPWNNYVFAPDHPALAGVPTTISASYVSHAAFDGLPVDASVLVTNQYGSATLVEYTHGSGRVIASGQTLEWATYRLAVPGLKLFTP